MMYRIFLIVFSFSTYGQLSDEKIKVEDFNRDTVNDTLKIGRGYVQIINGKTKEKHELSDYGCFCDIKDVVTISKELDKIENRLFLEAMKKELLPEHRSKPDASLEWMIKGAFLNAKLNDNAFFSHIYDPKVPWNNRNYRNINNYYIDIKGDTLRRLQTSFYNDNEQVDINTKGFFGVLCS
ncbi:hypothetical protein [uncultured Aquimarina sp.]|uniref:hypothetical protein n=1 Tax=uncultured Aquimarina sp. TaxID=575652 RepID=UPI0026072DE0|nr:hypothetical protein [uncultured Aquimarina sp.]